MSAEACSAPSSRAMPWVFVLIWSTGFVVARLAMPHAPPFGFLTVRFALSALCFVVWIALARAAWPREPGAVAASRGHRPADAGGLSRRRLGGGEVGPRRRHRRAAGRPAAGADGALADRATARRAARRRVTARQWLGLVLGFAGLGARRLAEARRRGDAREPGDGDRSRCSASPPARSTRSASSRRCDVRTASAVQMAAAFVVCLPLALLETEPMDWHLEPGRGDGVVGRRAHPRRQLAALPSHPARRGDRRDQPALPGAALHRADGVGYCSANRSRCS